MEVLLGQCPLQAVKSFSQASGLALAGGCLAALGTPQHVPTHAPFSFSSSHGFLPVVHVCAQIFPFYRASVILDSATLFNMISS